jgi:hypothetical protein
MPACSGDGVDDKEMGEMSWHYCLLKNGDTYAIYEVYKLDDGEFWTKDPICFEGHTPQDVISQMTEALEDITSRAPRTIEGDRLVPEADPGSDSGESAR